MWASIVVIQMVFISLTSAQQQFMFNNVPERWAFFVTPIRIAPPPSATPWLLPNQPVVRRDDYTYTPGIGGHKFHTRAATWNEARRICEEESGHLAVINSIAEANVITDLFNKSGAIVGGTGRSNWAFIGFHDLYQEGEFVTIHGHSLARTGFTQWAAGQPDSNGRSGVEDCGSVHRKGGLNDIGCKGKYGFICELPIW